MNAGLTARTKVALLCDSPDEHWPSMDLVGAMHSEQLRARHVDHEVFAPPIPRRTRNLSADRLLFRFGTYPSLTAQLAKTRRFDLYHVIDHSYSQLLHALPAGKAVVTCHDMDTFRSVLQPEQVRRGRAFRYMTKRVLTGFRKAAHVACDSAATRNEVLRYGLLPPDRVSVVPLGVHPSCSPFPNEAADRQAERLLDGFAGPAILHVGSTIERKRIDILLRVYAALRERNPELRLIRVGGPFSFAQQQLATELGVDDSIFELPFLEREVLAAVYRKAALVLLPSDAEGFGLPVAEAMACGTPVLASDLTVLREVGGEAAAYCPIADVDSWVSGAYRLLHAPPSGLREASLAQAEHFSWILYTSRMLDVYNRVLTAISH